MPPCATLIASRCPWRPSKVNDMSETTQPILMVLDGHSMAFRAFYALPVENFTTSTGQHTNAVHGFVAMLINLLRNEKPTHVAVAWDLAGGTFRTTEYSEYKAGRAAIPPEFPGQIDLIKEVLDALRIVHLSKENYEADDIPCHFVDPGDYRGIQNAAGFWGP